LKAAPQVTSKVKYPSFDHTGYIGEMVREVRVRQEIVSLKPWPPHMRVFCVKCAGLFPSLIYIF